MTVSYTHLDVYKRQDPEDAKRTLGLVLDIYRSSRENREIITERQAVERQAAER